MDAASCAASSLNTPTLVTILSAASLIGADGTLLYDVTTFFGEGGSYAIVNRVQQSPQPPRLFL